MRRLPSLLLVAAAVATTALAFEARADQSDLRFAEGMKFVEAGKFEDARQAFLQAYALKPTQPILWNLSISEYKVARHVDAIRHLKAYLRGSPTDPKYVQLAPTVMEKLAAATCHIQVETAEGADVLVNADPWPERAPLRDTIDVAPGNYAMEARKGDRNAKENTTCKAGETVKVKLAWQERPPPVVGPPAPPGHTDVITPPDTAAPKTWTTTHIVVTGGLGVLGVAGAVIGFVELSGAKGDESTSGDLLRNPDGTYRSCVGSASAECARAADLRKSSDSKMTVGTVALVGGGVFLAGAAASVFLWPTSADAKAARRVRPVLGAGWVGVDGAF